MKILVTGLGAISSIGNNAEQNFVSLKMGICGISEIENISNLRKPFVGGQIKYTDDELKMILGIGKNIPLQRSALLGLMAAREAWGNRKSLKELKTGIIFGYTIGDIGLKSQIPADLSLYNPQQKADYTYTHDSYFGTDFIANDLGIKNYKATISTACSSSANAIMVGARLIKAGLLDRVLVGGAEVITNFTLNGFDSLLLYSDEVCRPFDENRKGLNLGEAGCFLMIESEHSAKLTGQKKIAELIGWGNACDAFHQTASSPDGIGAVLAMKEAFKIAGCKPEEIDYINAHGTGTQNNDLSESEAVKTMFGNRIPPFSSSKSFIGHTLTAAGGIEAVYSVLAIQHQTIFANLNYQTPMKEYEFKPVIETIVNTPVRKVLCNSFGFGGNCTELIFSV